LLAIYPGITRICQELKKLNSPKVNGPIMKWATELNRTFSKDEVQMAKKHMINALHPCHKGNANQIHTKIPPHSCYNSYHQEHHHQQMLMRM
jgi:hypothetical protein